MPRNYCLESIIWKQWKNNLHLAFCLEHGRVRQQPHIFSTLIVALLHIAQIVSLAFLTGLSRNLNRSSGRHLFWKTVFRCCTLFDDIYYSKLKP